jgi:hypothetical protein
MEEPSQNDNGSPEPSDCDQLKATIKETGSEMFRVGMVFDSAATLLNAQQAFGKSHGFGAIRKGFAIKCSLPLSLLLRI